MVGFLAHAVHYLLIVLGLAGVAWLLLPQVQSAARGARRTTFQRPASPTEHEERVAALRDAVASGSLTTPTDAALAAAGDERDGSLWRVLAVASSVAAAGVHAAVFPHHLEESVVVGAFFLAATLAQAAWACLVVLDASDDRLLLGGVAGSLGLVAVWAYSRTVGIDWFGLGREAVGGWDLAAGAWELVVVVACLMGLRRSRTQRGLVLGDLGPAAYAWMLGSGVILVLLTLTAARG